MNLVIESNDPPIKLHVIKIRLVSQWCGEALKDCLLPQWMMADCTMDVHVK